MKENKYDDSVFFQKYSEMSRSKYGLQGAGEWQEFQKMGARPRAERDA